VTDHLPSCPSCDAPLTYGSSICAACGWDLTASAGRGPGPRFSVRLLSVLPRIVVYGGLIAVIVAGFLRYQATGPGPDLATTLRWMAFGDDGRAAELVTIHRAHEIGSAVSRAAIRTMEAPDFDDGWGDQLAPFATMNVRGYIPLLTMGLDTDVAPGFITDFYRVTETDGWGRPYRVATHLIKRTTTPEDDPIVASDLRNGLSRTFFELGRPDFDQGDVQRLELVSAGRDGRMDTDDDIRFISYALVGFSFRISGDPARLTTMLEKAYASGTHYFRLENSRYRLIEARVLAETRLDTLL
jgi:hypothetical protein